MVLLKQENTLSVDIHVHKLLIKQAVEAFEGVKVASMNCNC